MNVFPLWLVLSCAFVLVTGLTSAQNGPLPAEFSSWKESDKQAQRVDGEKMLENLFSAITAGRKDIHVPKAHYRFAKNSGGRYPAHIIFPEDMEGVTIDFGGSTLWFETDASGIVIPGAKNCTLRNAFLDWDPLPFVQGTVVTLQPESGTFDVRLDPGYEHPSEALRQETWRGRGIVFDPKTRELKEGQRGCEVTFSWAKRNPDGSYRLTFHGFYGATLAESGIEVGDPYAMLRRIQRAVRLERTIGCTLEDITLYAAPFIGFVQSGGSSPTFRRCAILRRPGTNRLMAGNADGINCDNLDKGPLIEDCRMETIGDDFVNVHGHLGRVIWQEEDGSVITTRLNRRASVTTPVEVEFLDRLTMKSLGKRMATWQALEWQVDAARCLADLRHKWHSGDAAALVEGKSIGANRLHLNSPLPIKGDVVVICEAFSGSGAIIRGNHFKGSLARGLRLQSPQVLVENNTISTTLGQGISLTSQAAYWGEGPYVHDATVENNVLERTGVGGDKGVPQPALDVQATDRYTETRLPRNIRIRHNTFLELPGAAIVLRGVDDVVVTDNRIEGFALEPIEAGDKLSGNAGAAIVLDSIGGLQFENNRISGGGPAALADPVVRIDIRH